MRARPDLIVVGCGISGLASALWLFESGLRPCVVPGPGVGDLLPQLDLSLALPWRRSQALNQLERRGMALMPELITRLAQETGVDLALKSRDVLVSEPTGEIGPSLPSSASMELRHGSVSDFEPQLAEGQRAIACLRARQAIRSDRLVRALRLALRLRGVDVVSHRAVKRLEVAGNIVLGVEMDNGEFVGSDATILAADEASASVLHESGLQSLNAGARLGPALQFVPSSTALTCALVESTVLLAPREDGRLVAISNLDGGQTEPLSHDQLRLEVHRRLPGLGRHDLEQSGRLPIPNAAARASIGAYPGVRGLWLNAGHDAFGPMIAPAAAEFLTEQLAGGPGIGDLAPFFSPSMQPS